MEEEESPALPSISLKRAIDAREANTHVETNDGFYGDELPQVCLEIRKSRNAGSVDRVDERRRCGFQRITR